MARAEKLVGTTARLEFYDWEANALTPNGKTVASQLQIQDPDGAGDQPGRPEQPRPGIPARAAEPVRRGQAGVQADPSRHPTTRAQARSTTCSAPRGAPRARPPPRPRGRPDAGRPLPGRRTRRQPRRICSGPATGVTASEAQILVPPGTVVLQARRPATEPHELQRSVRAVLRAQGPRIAVRQRDHQPAAVHRPGRQPDVPFGFNGSGKAFQNVTGDDRPPRRAQQPVQPAAQPALRGRARQAAHHGPADRLQALPGRDPGGQRRRHHRRVHDLVRAGPRDPAAARRAADQPQADLRVAGVGDARQAGAAPGPDRRPRRPAGRGDLPDRLLPRPRRDRDRRR